MSRNKVQKRPLRVLSPKLYHFIMDEFAENRIHSYDFLIEGEKEKHQITVTLYYGEDFTKTTTKSFSLKEAEEISEDVRQFVDEAVETCQETMKADYFKLMAP